MQFFNDRAAHYAVADFYAGIVASTFDVNVRSELHECMAKDEGLERLWDQALTHLSQGREEKWKASFREARERSANDLAECGKYSDDLHMLGYQLVNWWETFWGQGEEVALDIIQKNRATNKGALFKQVVSMRFNWETGYAFDAGKRLGNFWKILIGEPVWSNAGYHKHQQ